MQIGQPDVENINDFCNYYGRGYFGYAGNLPVNNSRGDGYVNILTLQGAVNANTIQCRAWGLAGNAEQVAIDYGDFTKRGVYGLPDGGFVPYGDGVAHVSLIAQRASNRGYRDNRALITRFISQEELSHSSRTGLMYELGIVHALYNPVDTPFYKALELLDNGERTGMRLNSRFALIVRSVARWPLLVYKKEIIGWYSNEPVRILPKYRDLVDMVRTELKVAAVVEN